MSRRTLIIILIVSVGINLGLLGFMGYDALRNTRLFHERRPLPHWLGTIKGITPEQTDRMHAIMTEGRDPMDKLRNELFLKRCELTVLIAEQNPDLAAIDAKITEISGIQAQIEKLIVRQIIAIRGVLTPEQQQMLFDYMGRCMMPPPPGPPFGDGNRHGPEKGPAMGWERRRPKQITYGVLTIDMSIERKQNKEDTVKKSIVAISIAALLITGLVIAGVAFADPRDDSKGPDKDNWSCPYYPGRSGRHPESDHRSAKEADRSAEEVFHRRRQDH